MEWLTEQKLPIGKAAKSVVEWITDNFAWWFDAFSIGMETAIEGLLWLLQAPHPLIIVGLVAALAWLLAGVLAA